MKTNRNAYQLVIVFQPKTSQKDREMTFAKVTEMVEKLGAKVALTTDLGTRELAYPIKKCTKGEFWQLDIEAEKTFNNNEINLFLNREPQVIRYLVLKKTAVAKALAGK